MSKYYESEVKLEKGKMIFVGYMGGFSAEIAELSEKAVKLQEADNFLWIPKSALIPTKWNKDSFKKECIMPNDFKFANWFSNKMHDWQRDIISKIMIANTAN